MSTLVAENSRPPNRALRHRERGPRLNPSFDSEFRRFDYWNLEVEPLRRTGQL